MFRYLVLWETSCWRYDDLEPAIAKAHYLGEDAIIYDMKDVNRIPVPKFKVSVLRDELVILDMDDCMIFSESLDRIPEHITASTPTERLYEIVKEYLYDVL